MLTITPFTFGYNISLINLNEKQSSDWPHHEGWPVTFEINFSFGNSLSNSVVCDLEGDGNLDVVVTYSLLNDESYIDAYNLDGSRKIDLGFPIFIEGEVDSEVSIGDLDNDGDVEIIASGAVFFNESHASIFVFEYNGEVFDESWRFIENLESASFYSSALGDIDGDGDLEIIVSSYRDMEKEGTGVVYALNHDGIMVSGWPVTNNHEFGSFYATPALGDIDNDGFLEVVVGTFDNYLYAWNGDGSLVSGKWPVNLYDDMRSHSPQLGDLDGDGKIEIVQIGARYGNITILNGQGIIIRILYPDIGTFSCTPSLSDIDGDGDLEIFASIGSYIYGWHHNGEKVSGSWPILSGNTINSRSTVTTGDINNDNCPDLLFICEDSNSSGNIFAYNADGTLIQGWPYSLDKTNNIRSSPTLIDIDKNGDVEVVFTYFYLVFPPYKSYFTIDILDLSGTYDIFTMHWPMFQNNLQHTGLYNKPGNNPPDKSTIDGPTNGKILTKYFYETFTSDPDDNNISYYFDWGDGKNSGWTEFVPSGTIVNLSHSWQKSGTFTIKVKAKDIYGMPSEWSELQVTMPRDKIIASSLLQRLFELFPLLEVILSKIINL